MVCVVVGGGAGRKLEVRGRGSRSENQHPWKVCKEGKAEPREVGKRLCN